ESLKQRYEQQSPGTQVELSANGSARALQSLLGGTIDLAAIGRGLTPAERQQGLTQVPVSREKIAVIVSDQNSLNQPLTSEQFARLFRGEIRNWSELGGSPGPVRFIDRPEESDTRQALRNYPVFQQAPFKSGANAVRVNQDSTAAVIQALGPNGIGYAIASQVTNQPGVRIVQMHETLPDDPRYPFSQPRVYVYKGQPNPALAAFLGFATAAAGQQVVLAAKPVQPAAVSQTVSEPTMTSEPTTMAQVPPESTETTDRGIPGWLPWLLFLLLAPLLWFFRRRQRAIEATPPPVETAAAESIPLSAASATPPPVETAATESINLSAAPPLVKPAPDLPSPPPNPPEPAPTPRQEYVSPPIIAAPPAGESTIPAVAPPLMGAVGLAAVGAAALTNEKAQTSVEAAKYIVGQDDQTGGDLASVDEGLADLPGGYGESRIVLLPRDPHWAYTYWDVPNHHREAVRRQGGSRLALRLQDVTDIDLGRQNPHSLQQYECDELARDWYVPIPVSDRDYLVEIGYVSDDGDWLMLARSLPVRVPPVYPSDWTDDQFLTIDWDQELQGNSFGTLPPPGFRTGTGTPLTDQIFAMSESAEADRVAGSLYGSMQHVPGSVAGSAQMASGQAISSYVLVSGIGMWASGVGMPGSVPSVTGMSGIGMSGIGMSGIGMSGIGMSGIGLWPSGLNMSGVGFSASAPPIRPRQFWLIADAELIVYGATEPGATVYIGGQPIELNPDGTFRFQMSFQDGLIDFPILAVAEDGVQTRAIHMTFNRQTPTRRTNTREEAVEEWPED
ncbi:MAG TPA: DUF4912 domain-containing protein, partial [Coleofasciculaceae cyanobacterium]